MIFQHIQELEAQIRALEEEGKKWIEQHNLIDFAGVAAFFG
jgi:hypothetical protein